MIEIRISIHQPGYLPWLGFFKKIESSDVFVFLDDVQYEKNGWQNRNKIRTSDGSIWLTVPIKSKLDLKINEIRIDNNSTWKTKHRKSIEINYSKAKHFQELWPDFESIYELNHTSLLDLNIKLINFLMDKLEIKTKVCFSSDLEIKEKSSDRILAICKALKADKYLSGALGKNYLKINNFEKNGIIVELQNFQHPVYPQCYEPFIPNMSTIDLLFNEGSKSSEILKQSSNF